MEITAEWKKVNEETQEKKVTLSAEKCLSIFKGKIASIRHTILYTYSVIVIC